MSSKTQNALDLIGVVGMALIAAGILMLTSGCDSEDSTDNSQTTVNNGIQLPTNAVEIADGIFIWQDGDGNTLMIDITSGDPIPVIVKQGGTNNVLTVTVHPPAPETATPEVAQ
jgi:hypothetical protein